MINQIVFGRRVTGEGGDPRKIDGDSGETGRK
jgi:hypothetical protein